MAEQRRRRDADDAGKAVRQPAPFVEHPLEHQREGERDKRKVPGDEPEGRQRHQHADRPRSTMPSSAAGQNDQ